MEKIREQISLKELKLENEDLERNPKFDAIKKNMIPKLLHYIRFEKPMDDSIRSELLEILTDLRDIDRAYYVLMSIASLKVIDHESIFLTMGLLLAPEIRSVYFATKVVMDPRVRTYCQDWARIAHTIAFAKGEAQAKCGASALLNKNCSELIFHPEIGPIVNHITKAPSFEKALTGTEVLRLKHMQEHKDFVSILASVVNAKERYQRNYITRLLNNPELCLLPEIKQIVESIANTQTELQARLAYLYAKSHYSITDINNVSKLDEIEALKALQEYYLLHQPKEKTFHKSAK